jgi:hypothetical protein
MKKNEIIDSCEYLVREIIIKPEDEFTVPNFKKYIEEKGLILFQFVNGFYDVLLWKKFPKFSLIEMDQLNLLHWVLFYNRKRILNHMLENYLD